MNSTRLTLILTFLSVILATGCASNDPNKRSKLGAGIGAVVGGVLGNQTNSKNGKYAGVFVGALTGAAIGNYMDKQQLKMERELAEERRNRHIKITRLDEQTLRLDVRSEASFDINSASNQSGFRKSLVTVAETIGEFDQTAVHIIGHTDSTGTESYNQQLSERRATSVTRFLSRNGVKRTRMLFSGRGETQRRNPACYKLGP